MDIHMLLLNPHPHRSPIFLSARWFYPDTSTTKTGRLDIAEILLKVALNTKNQIKFGSSNVCLSVVANTAILILVNFQEDSDI
jgi:hypothetical protein